MPQRRGRLERPLRFAGQRGAVPARCGCPRRLIGQRVCSGEDMAMKHAQKLLVALASLVAGACGATSVVAQNAVPASKTPGTVHILPATMETTQWGWYDSAQKPVLTVKPGDTEGCGRCRASCSPARRSAPP